MANPALSNEMPKRALGLALLVIATAQLMLVLDDSIVNIALPSIQRQFDVSASALPWIVNAYLLAFGGLLLFGGRVGDLFGRLRLFRVGIVIFTLASLVGGFGVNVEMLISSRALQGVGAALAAPNALALIATNFPVGKPRNQAMAIYGAMSALGITAGVLLGGVLTGMLSWRWVFFINAPIGLVVLLGSRALIEGERGTGELGTFDAFAATAAVMALALGISRGGEHSWTDPTTLVAFAGAAVLLVVFLGMQSRSAQPMLPLSLLAERNRAGSYTAMLLFGAGMMGTYYLLTLYMQQVLLFSPTLGGLASLPFAAGIVLGAGVSSKLVEKLPPRLIAAPGLLLGAVGMLWLSQLSVDSSYFAHVMPGVLAVSFGLGASAIVMTLTAVYGVSEDRTGVASALVNMAQQIGAALGIAAMTTVSTLVTNARLPEAASLLREAAGNSSATMHARQALTEGYSAALLAGAVILLAAAVVVGVAVNTRRTQAAAGALAG
ncbi:MFS transporter [Piscinibacter koreensis]|uniref:MFS transporter n=1 Tax=Piscinibacter koreensis TaxID=2742824 RepID=A0A7Y6TWC2_9BURK|nr:MFS transporter [Schlegelella koreensis]NUZ05974.1 MFS transporter [Schlegelella koreensis]